MSVIAKIGLFVVKIAVTLAIAFVLIQIVARLPTNMPYWIDLSMRWALHAVGRDDLANPDGMEDVGEVVFTALVLMVAAALVWGGHGLIRRRSPRRLHAAR